MIQGSFRRNQAGQIVSFEISGHANAGPYGSDLVCAAVSALSVSAVNGIESLAGFQPMTELNDEEDGYLSFEILRDITQEQTNIAQILLENLLLSLQTMEQEYTDFITIKTEQIN